MQRLKITKSPNFLLEKNKEENYQEASWNDVLQGV